MNFRYEISAKPKVSVFEPQKLAETVDRMSMRATQLGAALKGSYGKLPRTDQSGLLWEAL